MPKYFRKLVKKCVCVFFFVRKINKCLFCNIYIYIYIYIYKLHNSYFVIFGLFGIWWFLYIFLENRRAAKYRYIFICSYHLLVFAWEICTDIWRLISIQRVSCAAPCSSAAVRSGAASQCAPVRKRSDPVALRTRRIESNLQIDMNHCYYSSL